MVRTGDADVRERQIASRMRRNALKNKPDVSCSCGKYDWTYVGSCYRPKMGRDSAVIWEIDTEWECESCRPSPEDRPYSNFSPPYRVYQLKVMRFHKIDRLIRTLLCSEKPCRQCKTSKAHLVYLKHQEYIEPEELEYEWMLERYLECKICGEIRIISKLHDDFSCLSCLFLVCLIILCYLLLPVGLIVVGIIHMFKTVYRIVRRAKFC